MDLNGNLWQLSDLGGGSEVAEVWKRSHLPDEAIRKRTLPTKSEYGDMTMKRIPRMSR